MGEELRLPKIPCVFCGHGNPPGHRFCGMCGKALPDLVKQTKPVPGGLVEGGVVRPVVPPVVAAVPVAPKAPLVSPPVSAPPVRKAPRVENSNRDLSYLLHDDDHVPAPPSRMPFLIGGLILAAVAGFFVLRGGGKKTTPAVDPVTGEPVVSQTAPPPTETPKDEAPKAEAPKADVPKAEPAKAEPMKAESAPAEEPKTEPLKPESESATAATVPAPAAASVPDVAANAPTPAPKPPAAVKPHPAAAHRAPKPAPSRRAVAADDEDATPAASAGSDCESQLPSLRKAAARGDAKARANLGLAYYAGRCVPRDLPTSYHWYALALRTEPNSPLVSAQLEAIWKQMSPAEKQLALKAQ